MNEFEKITISKLLKHVVCIGGYYSDISTNTTTGYFYSGFILESESGWHLVTAGHNIKNFKKAQEASTIEIMQCSLLDFFNPDSVSSMPIPFDVFSRKHIYIDYLGIDIAMLKLHDLEKLNLLKNGIEPFNYTKSLIRDLDQYDQFGILGFPEEYKTPMSGNSFYIKPTYLPFQIVQNIKDYPVDLSTIKVDMIFGMLLDPDKPKKLTGMSGGPVIALKKTSTDIEYAIIGLQSAWYEEQRIAIVFPFETFKALLLEHAANQSAGSPSGS